MNRKRVSRGREVRLAPGCRLSGHGGRAGRMLLCPSGPVQLNELAGAVLALCGGHLTREQIVARILASSRRSLARNVRAFLTAAYRHGWLVESSARAARSAPARGRGARRERNRYGRGGASLARRAARARNQPAGARRPHER